MPFSVELYCCTLSIVASSLLYVASTDQVVLTQGKWTNGQFHLRHLPEALTGVLHRLPFGTHHNPLPLPSHLGCSVFLPASKVLQQPGLYFNYPKYKNYYSTINLNVFQNCVLLVCSLFVPLSQATEFKEICGCFSPCLRLLKAAEVCLELDDAISSLPLCTLVFRSHNSLIQTEQGCENSFPQLFSFERKYYLHAEIFPSLVRNFCVDCKHFSFCFCSSIDLHSRIPL